MQGYNAKDMARSFRTVRANTIKIAGEIPEEQYGFRASKDTRSVAETLAHIAVTPAWPQRMHGERHTAVDFPMFAAAHQALTEKAATLTTKAQILDALRRGGEDFAAWIEGLSDATLSEQVQFPPGMEPPSKTRFEMLLGVKEHEMHHRAQLMVVERMIGIVPHLTRDMEARRAQVQQQQQAAGG
jgi:uncharacterized damage-inducible protein DinB